MSVRIAELLSAAMVECEKEKNAALAGRDASEHKPLPRKWFAYDSLERKLRPLYHRADDEARRR